MSKSNIKSQFLHVALLALLWYLGTSIGATRAQQRRNVARRLDRIHLTGIRDLASMFSDCDLWFLVDSTKVSNLVEISAPRILYHSRRKFFIEKKKREDELKTLISKRRNSFWDADSQYHNVTISRSRNCDAYILCIWNSKSLQSNKSNVFDLASFGKHDIMRAYTVVMHEDIIRLPVTFYAMKAYDILEYSYIFNNQYALLRLYHVKLTKSDHLGKYYADGLLQNCAANSSSCPDIGHENRIALRGEATYLIADFKAVLLDTTPTPKTISVCRNSPQPSCIFDMGEESMTLGTARWHERIFLMLYKIYSVADIRFLSLEDSIFLKRGGTVVTAMHDYVIKFQEKYGRHGTLTSPEFQLLAEELLVHDLWLKTTNLTINLNKERKDVLLTDHKNLYERISGKQTFRFLTGMYIPVGHTYLTFLTCSNVTSTMIKDVFWWPFDIQCWILLGITTVAAAATLMPTIRAHNHLLTFTTLLVMIWRIFLENLQDMSPRLIKRPKMFSALVLLIAVASIVLSNGYRGVITMDFTVPTEITGPSSFEKVLDANWSMYFYHRPKSRRIQDTRNTQAYMSVFKYVFKWSHQMKNLLPSGAIPPKGSLLNIVERLLKVNVSIFSQWKACSCRDSALVLLLQDKPDIGMPKECHRIMAYTPFVVSNERILERTLSFSIESLREGLFFTAIRRAVEAGLDKWLQQLFARKPTSIVLKDRVLSKRITSNDPVALDMATALITSTFWFWAQMMVVAFGCFLLELTVWFLLESFSFERVRGKLSVNLVSVQVKPVDKRDGGSS